MRNRTLYGGFLTLTRLAPTLVICGVVELGFSQEAKSATITTFDVPGAAGQGTQAYGLNDSGTITGQYFDANGVAHGFVRTPDGAITTFDAPGAPQSTVPMSINAGGVTTGYYADATGRAHGFVRRSNGRWRSFDVPSANNTYGFGINAKNMITGVYCAGTACHGFLRASDGTITTFDALEGHSINGGGAITGTDLNHGFVRAPDGTVTTFDAPGGPTEPLSIDAAGDITGCYLDGNMVFHGFVRESGAP
jgi:hypothetical protein